jgi:hypothetical protein
MGSLNAQAGYWCCLALPVIFVLSGCGGAELLTAKDREIDALRYHNERKRESLIESMAETERQVRAVVAAEAEKKALSLIVSELEIELRSRGEELTVVRAERDSLSTGLAQSRGANERLNGSLDRVRAVAVDSANELANLRLRGRDLQARVRTLEETESTLRVEHSDLSGELERVKSELVRARAVARSFESGGEVYTTARDRAVRQPLENQIAALKEEKRSLMGRLDALGSGNTGAVPSVAGHAVGAVYQDDPAGLLAELGGLAKARYRKALQGHVAWDFFDLAVAGVVVLPLLAFLWILFRKAHWRKTTYALRSRVARRGGVQADQVPSASTSSGKGRGYSPPRQEDFSAVISSPSEDEPRESLAVETVLSEADPLDEVLQEGVTTDAQRVLSPAEEEPARSESDPVMGARVWTEDMDPKAAEAAEVVPRLSVEDLVTHEKPEALRPQAPAAEPPGSADDAELLSELKSVINKKFDELLK